MKCVDLKVAAVDPTAVAKLGQAPLSLVILDLCVLFSPNPPQRLYIQLLTDGLCWILVFLTRTKFF